MNVGINGRFLTTRVTGVQRFASEIAQRLAALGPTTLLKPQHGPINHHSLSRSFAAHAWEQYRLPRAARRAHCDVLLNLATTAPMTSGRSVVVIHDLFPLTHPQWFTKTFAFWYGRLLRSAGRRANALLVPTEWVRQQLIDRLNVAEDRVTVVGQGLSPFDRPATAEAVVRVRHRLGLSEPFVLTTAANDRRKNLQFLLNVFADWSRTSDGLRTLVVVGESARWVHPPVALADSATARVRFLNHVPDETLHALMTGAEVFCFPSLAEGFGRPPLEAMACGTPVIASNYDAAAEVLGDAAMRLPLLAERWAQAFTMIVEDPDERQRLIRAGVRRAALYNWQQPAETIHAVCERVVSGEVSVPCA